MNSEKLFSIIELLRLPKGEWAVFGGACLTARDIRPTSDLEIFVTPTLYETLKNDSWEEKVTGSTGAKYITKIYTGIPVLAFINCGSDRWRPAVEDYLRNPELIHEQPFMPLKEMYKWKKATARPKDLADLRLIKNYLEQDSATSLLRKDTV